MYGFWLICTLILISAIIAWVGDRLGKWLGRRRISLFRLRPRHTATLVTVIAGMGIAGVTLMVMVSVSEPARWALTGIDKLLEHQDRLRASNLQLEAKSKHLLAINARLKQRVSSVNKQLIHAKSVLNQLLYKHNSLIRITRELKASIAERAKELLIVKSDLNDAQTKLTQTQQEYKLTQEKLDGANREIENAERVIEKVFKPRINELQIQLSGLKQQVAALEALRGRLRHMRAGKLTFAAGEEILTKLFKNIISKAEAKSKLEEMLEEANRLVLERGAKGEPPAILLTHIRERGGEEERVYFQEELLEVLSEELAEIGEDVIIRLSALVNCVEGEPVVAHFKYYKNQLIFKKGELIAEDTFNGALAPVEIYKNLLIFLTQNVSSLAKQKGIMPDKEGKVGEISLDALFALMERIKSKGRLVEVKVISAEDNWTKGPLRIKFEVVG